MYGVYLDDKSGEVTLVGLASTEKEAVQIMDWWYENMLSIEEREKYVLYSTKVEDLK